MVNTCCTHTLCIKPFVLLLIRCPHGTVLLEMVGGSWYGRRRGSWGGKSEDEWFCQKCSTGIWWSRTECRHCASVTNDTADVPQSSIQEKIAVLEKTLACRGNDEPIFAGNRVLETELERHQKKLNGPKITAKHIETKQSWINRESKRIETESAKLAEMQESLGVRKETLRAAHEEIRILRGDLLREGESMDRKQESHHVPREHGGNTKSRTTRTESADRSRCEETGWMDERWIDR